MFFIDLDRCWKHAEAFFKNVFSSTAWVWNAWQLHGAQPSAVHSLWIPSSMHLRQRFTERLERNPQNQDRRVTWVLVCNNNMKKNSDLYGAFQATQGDVTQEKSHKDSVNRWNLHCVFKLSKDPGVHMLLCKISLTVLQTFLWADTFFSCRCCSDPKGEVDVWRDCGISPASADCFLTWKVGW